MRFRAFTQAEGATHVDNFNSRRFAFTLAEVLITLGVIGVVASLTMPTLIQNHQKKVLQTQFKKAYSTVQNAYRGVEANEGYLPACYYQWNWVSGTCQEIDESGNCTSWTESQNAETNGGPQCEDLYESMKNTLKVVKECDGNALSRNCIPAYKGIDTITKARYEDEEEGEDHANRASSGCGNFRESYIHNNAPAWVLADGTIIFWFSKRNAIIAVDVNGKKAPNKWGHDLFAFNFYKKQSGGVLINGSGAACSIPEDGGVSTGRMIEEVYK